jgi:ubiquinol-cytochrome c reductase cytochrome c subunit
MTPSRLLRASLRFALAGAGRVRRADRLSLGGPAIAFAIAAVAFSFVVLTGGTASGAPPRVSSDPATVAAGAQLYAEHCQSCHGINGVGGVNGSPELIDSGAAASDFYLTTGRMPLNNPHDQALRHRPYFNNQEITDLNSYVAALPQINKTSRSGPGIPEVAQLCPAGKGQPSDNGGTPAAGACVTLSQGQQLYQLNCAQCHQATGAGGMLSKGNVIPTLHNADETQVAEAVRVGPKPMPIFGANQLTNEQVSAIAHYVQYLHHPENKGGLSMGGFGPVAEGFAGVLGGFCVLLVVARLIGTRG